MTATYQTEYRDEMRGTGREIRIADGVMSYWYDLAEGDTLQDAIDSFAESYDYNLDPGQDPAKVRVNITAEEYRDGEEVDILQAVIGPTL